MRVSVFVALASCAAASGRAEEKHIVEWCPGTDPDADAVAEAVGATIVHRYRHVLKGVSVRASKEAAAALAARDEVCDVRRAQRLQGHGSSSSKSNDYSYSYSYDPCQNEGCPFEDLDVWNLRRINAPTLTDDAPAAKYAGRGATIVVLDGGLDTRHDEFANTDERVVANIADCVDPWRYYPAWGWDTLAEAGKTVEDTVNNGFNYHGTFTSANAAGARVGAAPLADLLHIRTTDEDGGGTDAEKLCAYDLIEEAVAAGLLTGRTVINESFGGPCSQKVAGPVADAMYQDPVVCGAKPKGEADFFEYLNDNGIAVTVAAGNDNENACFYRLMGSPFNVVVGASDKNDAMASFSNYGACVDVFAPGDFVASALNSRDVKGDAPPTSTYKVESGTSYAAPLTAGIVARYMEALGDTADGVQAMNAMLHAVAPDVISPSDALLASSVEACPTNAALVQAPVTVKRGRFDTSDIAPRAECALPVNRIAGWEQTPVEQCEPGRNPEPPVDAPFTFVIFNVDSNFNEGEDDDSRIKSGTLCFKYFNEGEDLVGGTWAPPLAAGESLELGATTSTIGYAWYRLKDRADGADACTDKNTKKVTDEYKDDVSTPGFVVAPVDTWQKGGFIDASDCLSSASLLHFLHLAPDVGKCTLFVRRGAGDYTFNVDNMKLRENLPNLYADYESDGGHCFERCQLYAAGSALEFSATCSDGVTVRTTSKVVCEDWLCPTSLLWVITRDGDDIKLSFAQARNCGADTCMKKNACADSDTWTTVPGGEGCDWVAKKEGRCQTKGTLPGTKGKVVASYACPVACGKKMCRDDASWHKKGKPHLTCAWVSAKPYERCAKRGADGVVRRWRARSGTCPDACAQA